MTDHVGGENIKKTTFNSAYKLLAFICVSAVASAVVYAPFSGLFSGLSLALWASITTLAALGYLLQTLYGAVTMRRHDPRAAYRDESGYEGTVTAFTFLRAAGPIVLSAVLALLSYRLFDRVFYLIANRTDDDQIFYTGSPIYPILLTAVGFAAVVVGIVIWFYPAHRVISLKTMKVYIVLLWLAFLVSVIFGEGAAPIAPFLIVFAICSFIVLNQTHIQRGVTGTLTALSFRGRIYNFRIILFALVSVFAVTLAALSILIGLRFVFRFIFAMFLANALKNDEENVFYDSGGDVDTLFGNVFFNNQPIGERFFIVLFIALFIGAIFILATRGTKLTRKLIDKLKLLIDEFFMFFMDAGSFRMRTGAEDSEFANFKDEEIKLQRADKNGIAAAAEKTESYRDFVARLNALPTLSEQIRFAYTVLMAQYRRRNFGNSPSMTPREAEAAIRKRSSADGITDITDAIETVDFEEKEISADVGRKALSEMGSIIERSYEK